MEGSVACLVERIKEEMLSPSADMYSFLPPSAYETAWVAMVPSPHHPNRPMFPKCLQWILRNQREEGFWGESEHSMDSLTATIACLVALKTWNTGHANVEQGLRFLNANTEKMLMEHHGVIPRWFAIVFPGMLELAHAKGLEVLPVAEGCKKVVDDVFDKRTTILESDQSFSGKQGYHPPVNVFFLEALPASCRPKHEVILAHQMEDGSLFHSPSATAAAFMITGDKGFKDYLQGMVRSCGNIVPPMFPVDQNLVKLCLVDHLRRLGCGEHLAEETRGILDQVYSDWVIQEPQACKSYDLSLRIQKDSLAFQLLRAHGYDVSPRKFCWFMDTEELLLTIEENYSEFLVGMLGVYRAARFMFPNEVELHNAKLFAEKILQKSLPDSDHIKSNPATTTDLQQEIQHELRLPWLARMDHLEQRMCIERSKGYNLWVGKASSCRLLPSKSAIQLAIEIFTNSQLYYKSEHEELKRWSKEAGLSSMGFGREKTTYCYFLTAVAVNLPSESDLRLVAAKCAILVTVIDDFFDEKGSHDELESLTTAVKRWEGEGLSGHSKVIFDALDNLVRDISFKVFSQHGHDVKRILQDMWKDTFDSWLKESNWSKRRQAPPVAEYLEVAKISIAIQVMTLPACCMVIPEFPKDSINSRYSKITELTMIQSRLLNDLHSYQKEIEVGKFNMVPLYIKENRGASVQDSIEYIKKIIERKEKEFIEIYMTDTYAGAPKEWKKLHLATLKSFRMLFNTTNAYDSPTALLKSINDAFYEPLVMDIEQMFSREKEASYEPVKEKWSVPLGKYSEDGLLIKTNNGFGGKHRNELHDEIKIVSANIKQSLNPQRSAKTWNVPRSRSSYNIAFMIPSINAKLLAYNV